MRNCKSKLIAIMIFAACIPVSLGKTTEKCSKERILGFPKDRSLGMLKIQDVNTVRQIKDFHHWITKPDWWDFDWEYLCEAQGDVNIPVGKRAGLFITNPAAWRDLSPLKELKPDDLYILSISGCYQDVPRSRDKCMDHLKVLTGLKVLVLNHTNITNIGIQNIE